MLSACNSLRAGVVLRAWLKSACLLRPGRLLRSGCVFKTWERAKRLKPAKSWDCAKFYWLLRAGNLLKNWTESWVIRDEAEECLALRAR